MNLSSEKQQASTNLAKFAFAFAFLLISMETACLAIAQPGSPAQQSSSRRFEAPNTSQINEISILLQQLGDDDYIVRELAETKLRAFGGAAMTQLDSICNDPQTNADTETILRARKLLVLLKRDDFQQRKQNFLTSASSPIALEAATQFHGWAALAKRIGDNPAAREIYIGIIRDQASLIAALPAGPKSLQLEFDSAIETSMQRSSNSQRLVDALNALMFASLLNHADLASSSVRPEHDSAQPVINLSSSAAKQIASNLNSNGTIAYIRTCRQREVIESLLSQWLTRLEENDRTAAELRLSIVDQFELPEQVTFAVGLAGNKNFPVETRQRGLEVLLKLNDPSVLTQLRLLLDDRTEIGKFPNPQPHQPPLEIQFRDLVLAVCVLLSGDKLTDFGFQPNSERVETSSPSPQFRLNLRRLGFSSASERETAIKKYLEK